MENFIKLKNILDNTRNKISYKIHKRSNIDVYISVYSQLRLQISIQSSSNFYKAINDNLKYMYETS